MSLLVRPFNAQILAACDLERPIAASTCVDCEDFESAFLEAAKVADKGGEDDQAAVYRLLAAICSFHFKPDDPLEPFSNRIGFADGSRTLIGSDFSLEQISALYSITPTVENTSLRTRISDLVWTGDKSRADCARLAIDGYVALVHKLLDGSATERFHEPDPTGVSAEEFLRRATIIARATGWNRPENDLLKRTIADVLTVAVQREDMSVVRIGRLAIDVWLDSADEILRDLPNLVDTVLRKPDYFIAEAIQHLVIRRARRAHDDIAVRDATLRLVAIFEAKADAVDGAMLKAHALQEAIDALHGLQNVRAERQRLHDKLKDCQIHMYEEFGRFEQKIDLTDEVTRLLKGYDGLDLFDALLRLAQTELPRPSSELIDKAREDAQKFPLSSLFSSSIVDGRGRTVARTSGGIENEDTLRHKIIQSESIRISLAVAGAINPARQKISELYHIDHDVLYELFFLSPFVPSGSAHAFAKGALGFIKGDDFAAAAALIPLLEAGMRALVAAAGRSDTKIAVGGIEASLGLGPLLGEHRDVLDAVFGDGTIFCVENLFGHDLGPKIRHNFCHGLSNDGVFSSEAYVYGVKLIFSLAMLPLGGSGWDDIKDHVKSKLGRGDKYFNARSTAQGVS